ncbi:MAG TPA: two-component regulator propeller domain-containing protein [Chitinophagaceae bacterium]|nr:two-component regulator propeller domain-containing protein [Chitinophagaceae bacterium]
MRKKLILSPLLAVLVHSAGLSQPGEIVFTRMTKENGLASSRVNSILKDHQGYYWISSSNGLQRFDGKRMVTFQHDPADSFSLPDNNVNQLKEDNQQRVWLNIAGNPYIYDRMHRRFKKIKIEYPGTETFRISSFVLDSKGLFWILVRDMDPFVLDTVNTVFKPYTSIWPRCPARITNIIPDAGAGYYWIVTVKGIMIYDPGKREYYNSDHNPQGLRCFSDSAFLIHQEPVHKDPANIIWTQSWSRDSWVHHRYDIQKNELVSFPLNAHLWGYLTDDSGNTWCYGDSLGYFDKKTLQYTRILPKKNSLSGIDFNEIFYMMEDEENNIWVITNLGLYSFNLRRQHFSTTSSLWSYNAKALIVGNTTGFIETNDGHIISLSWGGDGLNFFDTAFNRVHKLYGFDPNSYRDPDYLFTWCGLQDSRGLIWIGCQHGHILQVDPVARKTTSIVPPEFQNLTIRSMVEDKNGNIWFGTQHDEIVKWIRSSNTFKTIVPYAGKYSLGWVVSLLPGSDDDLWAGTMTGGLLHIDINTDQVTEHFLEDKNRDNSLSSSQVNGMVMINPDTFAIATAIGIDLFDWRRRRFTHINKAEGLPAEGITSIVKDDRDNLWFSSVDGISKIHLPDRAINNYGFADGITERDFLLGSVIRLRSKRILFGNTAGFVSFNPNSITDDRNVPSDVRITAFIIFDYGLSVDSLFLQNKTVRLRSSENYITIQFASLGNSLNNRPHYYYMLEGIDKDWVKATEAQEAIYTYLPAGTYTFKVRCVSKDGVAGNTITSFRIRVNPFFWKTWWFTALLLSVVAGISYYIYLLRMRRRNEREVIRNRIARDLHDDMGSTLSTINILSSMAKSKLNIDAIKTSEYINKIGDNSQRMMEAMDDIVWAIKPDNDSMQRIVARMREFATSVLEAKDIDIEFTVDDKVDHVKLNMEQRRDFFLLFKEAVNNIAKYSHCRKSVIQLCVKQNRLVLVVRDDGVGFDTLSADNGNGLGNMQKRADSLRGRLQLQSKPGEGTVVTLNIPVG